jgi:hypothetical protein
MFWNTRIDIDVVCVSSYSLCDVLEHQGILMLFVSYCLWCFGTPGYIDVFMCLNIASDFFSTRVYIYVVYVSFYSICDVLNARVYWCFKRQGILMLFMCPIDSHNQYLVFNGILMMFWYFL